MLKPVLQEISRRITKSLQKMFQRFPWDFERRREYLREYGLEDSALVIAGDWMCLGPMVHECFDTFPLTGNPQREIEDVNRLVIAEILAKVTERKVLLPFSEKDLHLCMIQHSYSSLLPESLFEEEVKGKLEWISDHYSYVFPYQTFSLDFDVFGKLGMKVLGPKNLGLRDLLANKVHFYEFMQRLDVPVIPGGIASDVEEAIEIMREYGDVFVSREVGSGGFGSFRARSAQEIRKGLQAYKGKILVTKWLHKLSSQNVLAITIKDADEDDVAVLSISDQIIQETRYLGNVFPCSLPKESFDELVEMTKRIGAELGSKGYAGIFGLDALTAIEGKELKVYPIELNLRVNHSHGLAAALYSNIRDGTPVSVMHTIACLDLGWIGKRELKEMPINPEEMPHVGMGVIRMQGWRLITKLPDLEDQAIGFPPEGWILPLSKIDVKSGLESDQGLFIGRVLAHAESRKEVIKKILRSKSAVEITFEVL